MNDSDHDCKLCETRLIQPEKYEFSVFLGNGMLLLAALLADYEELITGDSQCGDQDHELLEVHLAILVFIQVIHNLLDHHGVLAGLKKKRKKRTK